MTFCFSMSMRIFLDESDRNNNGIRDEEENDKDPNYEFDVGLQGIRLFMNRK